MGAKPGGKRPNDTISQAVSSVASIGSGQRRSKLSNERLRQIVATLYLHKERASSGVLEHRTEDLGKFAERMKKISTITTETTRSNRDFVLSAASLNLGIRQRRTTRKHKHSHNKRIARDTVCSFAITICAQPQILGKLYRISAMISQHRKTSDRFVRGFLRKEPSSFFYAHNSTMSIILTLPFPKLQGVPPQARNTPTDQSAPARMLQSPAISEAARPRRPPCRSPRHSPSRRRLRKLPR